MENVKRDQSFLSGVGRFSVRRGIHLLALCLLFALSLFLLPEKALASKISLSKDMLLLDKGQRQVLSIGKKAEWILWDIEDQKNVVSITPSKDGKSCTVLAKKAGYAIVSAYVGGKDYVCWISVPRYRIALGKAYRFVDAEGHLHQYVEVTNKSRKSIFLSYLGESRNRDTLEVDTSVSGQDPALGAGQKILLDIYFFDSSPDVKVYYAFTDKEASSKFQPGVQYLSVKTETKGKSVTLTLKNKNSSRKLWNIHLTVLFLKGDKVVGVGEEYVEKIQKGGSTTVKLSCDKAFTSVKVYKSMTYLKKVY